MKINESGRSMIEMLGVLAIIGVLSVGGIAGYSKAMNKYRVNKTIDQISHIAANTRILFSAQKDYEGISDTVIEKAKLFPDDVLKAEKKNPFAGDVSLAPSSRFTSGDTGDNKAFVITYGGIPEEACIDLLTIDWGTGTAGGIISLGTAGETGGVADQISGKDSDGKDNCTPATGLGCGAMTVTEAVDACNGDDNTLYFKFY